MSCLRCLHRISDTVSWRSLACNFGRPCTLHDEQPEAGSDYRQADVVQQSDREPSRNECGVIPEPEVVMQNHEQTEQRPGKFSHGGQSAEVS